MSSGYTQEELANALARVQQRRKAIAGNNTASPVASRDYREGASDYNDFAPKEMDTEANVNPFAAQISEQIGRVSTQATARSGVEAQNRFNFLQLQEQQRRLRQARKNRVKATKQDIKPPKPLSVPQVNQPTAPLVGNQVSASEYTGDPTPAPKGTSYYTQTPGFLDPSAGLTTFNAGGHSWTLNASVAERFKNFINALTATGYKIHTAGSYANRNQANGSGNKSLHAYGLAIDINAFTHNSYNPGNAGVHKENLPKGISALAAKYGLVWGGDWKNSKDYMHFSIPYKGLL